MTSLHTDDTISGISWNGLRVLFQTFAALGVMAILARILPPEDFGLMALAMVFIGLADLLTALGMGSAVVQKSKLTEQDIRIAHTVSLTIGIVIAATISSFSTLIAHYFAEPRLVDIIQMLSFSLILSSAGSVSRGLLIRNMAFKKLFIIDFLSYLLGYICITLILAYSHFGVWSLVLGAVTQSLLMMIMTIYFAKAPLKFLFHRTKASSLSHFGLGVSMNNSLNYLAANIDFILIGKYLNANALGLYSRAYHLVSLPLTKISATITTVMFPAYAKVQHDEDKLRDAYFKVVEVTTLLVFPVLTGFFIGAEWVILGLFGQNWLGAVIPFKILCIAGLFKSVFHLAGSLAQAMGAVYSEMKYQFIYFCILVSGCYYAVDYGIEAVAWVVVLASVYLYFAMAKFIIRLIKGSWRSFFKAQQGALVVSVCIMISGSLFNYTNQLVMQLPPSLALPLFVFLSACTYTLVILKLPSKYIGQMPLLIMTKLAPKLPKNILSKLVYFSPHLFKAQE